MSLLEDVFLENEAGEAQELERIIEGDDFDERPRSRSDSEENSTKEDEAEEDKRRVDPTNAKPKKLIKNPRFVLNPARLTGPRGIQVLPEHFKDFKFKGKGHEKDDLDLVLKKLEHWAYRLYPKFQFEDCLKKIETLGKKRAVSVHLTKIRMDMITSEETVVQKDSSDDETPTQEPQDEFDKLLQQQIEIARATPTPSSVKKTPFSERSSIMPKATSSPSINDEQRERMLRNRRMAEERRLARLEQNKSKEDMSIQNSIVNSPTNIINVANKKQNMSVIDSSDDENQSVTNVRNNGDTIELDNDGIVVTKSPKTYVPPKKRKNFTNDREDVANDIDSRNEIIELDDNGKDKLKITNHRIDSSDDDDTHKETITIDVEKHHSDIVELDENRMVASNSTKTYVPAKKHNKSKIDSSDDDDLQNEPITIDVEKHHNAIVDLDENAKVASNSTKTYLPAKKYNKSKIDSSDDDDLQNEHITMDVEKHHNAIVELDENAKVASNSTKTYLPAKKHNKSKIDSSDDDDLQNEPITIDVEKHHDNTDTRSKIANINEKSMDNLDDYIVINDTETNIEHNNTAKNNNSYIDSSDSEDEAVVMNESITVDIHDTNNLNYDSNKITNINDTVSNKDIVFDSLKVSNTFDTENIEQSEIELHKSHSSNESNDNVENNFNIDKDNIKINKATDLAIGAIEIDEVMDVDFSDDF